MNTVFNYGLSVFSVLTAAGIRYTLDPWISLQVPFLTFFFAIMLATWNGGLGPGLLASALSALVAQFFFIEPAYHLTLQKVEGEIVPLFLFVLETTIITVFSDKRKRTEEALRQSEARFRTIFQQTVVGMAETDLIGRFIQVNQLFCQIVGRSPQELYKLRMQDITHPDDLKRHLPLFQALVEGTGHPFVIEKRYVCPDGAAVWVSNSVSVVRNQDGQPKSIVTISLNITDHKQSEEGLEALSTQLEQLVEERTAELQQSQVRLRALATDLNLAEQRERKRLATELHDHLAQLLVSSRLKLAQAKRVSEVVPQCADLISQTDEILNTSLTYVQTLVADLCPPVLHEFGLPAALKWLGNQMARQDMMVATELCDTDDLKLPEDQAVLLFQSVRELLLNAAKYAATGTARLRLYRTEGSLHIQVRDEGVGFNLESHEANGATNSSLSQFGLFSIRERMKALGGVFHIQSSPGLGTTATITVPVAVRAGAISMTDLPSYSKHGSLESGLSMPRAWDTSGKTSAKVRVLLVDDHAMVRQGLRSVLETSTDIEVVGEASDGTQAVLSVAQLQPSVVVMDISMPKMNGIEATAEIKAQFPRIVVIGLSINADGDNQEAMKAAGAAMLITKEAAVEQLYGAIQQAVSKLVTTPVCEAADTEMTSD